MTAVARGLHIQDPAPWVLEDRLADLLAGELGGEIRDRLVADLRPAALRTFSRWCCVRSRFPEDLVEQEHATNGTRQYVILGAGLDTFALRRPELAERVVVFEVDHPSSQQWKRDRLEHLQLGTGAHLVYTPVDFERDRLDNELR